MSAEGKWGRDIAVGDIFTFMGTPNRITALRPIPDSPLVLNGTLPPDSFVAESERANGYVWGITICPDSFYAGAS